MPYASSRDALFAGTLVLHQPSRGEGYRVNVDAVVLAHFAGRPRRARRAVDLGSGVGAVGLSLLYRDRVDHVTLVDVDRDALALARRNLDDNAWTGRGACVWVDLATRPLGLDPASADLVVSNPPYVTDGRGRPPKVARAARMGDVHVFTRAARHVLGARGRACFIYPATQLFALVDSLRASGLEPKRLRCVHPSEGRPARVVLVEATAAKRGGLVVEPPLVERDEAGASAAMEAMLAARATCSSDRAPV